MFGVPLSQCVESERALRRQQHGGSRASLASLGALEKGDDVSGIHSNDLFGSNQEVEEVSKITLVAACKMPPHYI